jgi:AraC-like DNA-binding protein
MPKKINFAQTQIEEIIDRYMREETCLNISKDFNCSETTIARILKNAGTKLRQTKDAQVNAKRRNIAKEQIEELYYFQNKSTFQIAELFSCNAELIRKLMQEFGLQRRDKSAHLRELCGARKIYKTGTQEQKAALYDKVSRARMKHSQEEYDELLADNLIIRVDEFPRRLTNKILFNCIRNQEHYFYGTIGKYARNGSGCPQCKAVNEFYCYKFLNETFSQEQIIREYKLFEYEFLGKKRKAYVDFFIKTDNFCAVVEYNGAQHYEVVNFGNEPNEAALKRYEAQVFRDNFLKQYCLDNNIFFIEIDGRFIKGNMIKNYIESRIKEVLQ